MEKNLWKKESDSADAPFVDLFMGINKNYWAKKWNRKLKSSEWKNELKLVFTKVGPGKNNQISNDLRNRGNAIFKEADKKAWINAMQLYSQSLCFAVLETNNVSFAYANRATCFLNLERYDECLQDIALAEQANYPNMPKLNERKAKCVRLMKNADRKTINKIKLSFEPNEKFPCMAESLEIQKNDQFGRHVIAKRDIDVGQTVLVEKLFMSSGCAPDRVQCYNCTKEDTNFIACSKCTDVMFCSEKCQHEDKVHEKFCGAIINRMPHDVRYLGKSLMIGMILFATGSEMMNFVSEKLAKRETEVPAAVNDPLSEYGLFLSLKPRMKQLDIELIYKVYTALLNIPLVSDMFNTLNQQRFLMHLIGEHWLIISNNGFQTGSSGVRMADMLGVVASLFNHSCAPNLFNMSLFGIEYFIALRPIKKGEQAFIKYTLSTALSSEWDFSCKCEKCVPRCSLSDKSLMRSDPDYRFLKELQNPLHALLRFRINEHENKQENKSKCVNFLQKFGHLPWCSEMDYILEMYTEILVDFVKQFG